MKIPKKKRFISPFGTAVMVLSIWFMSACQDMDKWDAPAGNQTIPTPEPPADLSAKLVAKYTFEDGFVNELDETIIAQPMTQPSGVAPIVEANAERGGNVLHQYFGFADANSISYTKFANPLKDIEDLYGASVSLWVNRLDTDVWDAIWSFLDEDNSDGIDGRFYLTPNAYLGFNGTGGFFDCNWPDNPTNAIAVSEWNMVTITINVTGFNIYINGVLKYSNEENNYLSWNANDGTSAKDFNYLSVINLLKSSDNFYLGYGSWWGSAPLLIDDLLIYNGVLTASEIKALYDSYSGLVAYYNFESNLTNIVDSKTAGKLMAQETGMLPTYEANAERGGTILHQYFGYDGAKSISYAEFPNPLKGQSATGATVSLWVNREDSNVWDGMWSFLDNDNSDGIDGRVYLTPNAYLGFNGTGGYFDCNWPDNVTNAIPVSTWSMVTVTLDTGGFGIYIDGVKKYDKANHLSWGSSGPNAATFDYSHIINLLNSADKFYLGYGSWWGSAPLLFDDLMIYNRVLSASDILELYNSSK